MLNPGEGARWEAWWKVILSQVLRRRLNFLCVPVWVTLFGDCCLPLFGGLQFQKQQAPQWVHINHQQQQQRQPIGLSDAPLLSLSLRVDGRRANAVILGDINYVHHHQVITQFDSQEKAQDGYQCLQKEDISHGYWAPEEAIECVSTCIKEHLLKFDVSAWLRFTVSTLKHLPH